MEMYLQDCKGENGGWPILLSHIETKYSHDINKGTCEKALSNNECLVKYIVQSMWISAWIKLVLLGLETCYIDDQEFLRRKINLDSTRYYIDFS